jgi:hypothetical protein
LLKNGVDAADTCVEQFLFCVKNVQQCPGTHAEFFAGAVQSGAGRADLLVK